MREGGPDGRGTPGDRERALRVTRSWRTALAVAGGAALAAHLVPAATWLPRVRRAAFPALDGYSPAPHVALTFDDGPDPASTPRFLKALDQLNVHATFFLLGEHVADNRLLVAEIAAQGHELAVHGWSHRRPWLPGDLREFADLKRAQTVVEEIAGGPVTWYRPPYGILTGERWAAAARCGLRPVLWSAWGRDWTRSATGESVMRTLRPDLRAGATVLLHDSDRVAAPGCWRATLNALPRLVAECEAAGLGLGPLSEHFGAVAAA
jgi:peptidoglycan-N-acetylglucosamine deacetylase